MKIPKPVVRPARKADYPRIIELIKQYHDKLETRDGYIPPWNQFFVVTINRKIVYCAALSYTPEFRSLASDKDHRGGNYGALLIKACEARAVRQCRRQVVLFCEQDMMRYFGRYGYRVSKGTRYGMVKDLTPAIEANGGVNKRKRKE